jgi:hypothetical protein
MCGFAGQGADRPGQAASRGPAFREVTIDQPRRGIGSLSALRLRIAGRPLFTGPGRAAATLFAGADR